MDTRREAQGKWRGILAALGVPAKILNGKHHPCPIPGCGGKDRFRFDDKDGTGSYICGQCGAGQGFKLLQGIRGWDFKQAAREVDKIIGNIPKVAPVKHERMKREDVAQMWKSARPIKTGDAVYLYLQSRGILGSEPNGLRLVQRMWHAPSRTYLPCMLANFRSADDESGTIHRTYIGDVESRRMFVPFAVPKGGAIRLFDADLVMGVAEGIETALSAAMLFKMPVWACANEGMLRQWKPPRAAKRITIFGDNDSSFVGQSAAYYLAWRLGRAKLHVTVEIPPTPDWDWNDVLKNEINTDRFDLPELRLADGERQSAS